jgi:hypothetical protein
MGDAKSRQLTALRPHARLMNRFTTSVRPRPHILIREAAFVLQVTVRAVEAIAPAFVAADGTPGLTWVGGRRCVDVDALRHFH